MKYVIFYNLDGSLIGYLPTKHVAESYDGLAYFVLDNLPEMLSKTPEDKVVYVDMITKTLKLAEKPLESPRQLTAEEEIAKLKEEVAALTELLKLQLK
ncbi:hypothetical protein MH117_05115 [Paenibacillus sp. ACRRX]|uniref:hypothetical protein n=1 Tax=Paenibacillus sp. ACRRX TaxID=2918206 RepID=UPI001EF4D905|nr:hypothetical protein [Paenibacillus sp. ACRRX]MCG7406791.1 hypothetical protein [Paenibacillus sp. ACRRX]